MYGGLVARDGGDGAQVKSTCQSGKAMGDTPMGAGSDQRQGNGQLVGSTSPEAHCGRQQITAVGTQLKGVACPTLQGTTNGEHPLGSPSNPSGPVGVGARRSVPGAVHHGRRYGVTPGNQWVEQRVHCSPDTRYRWVKQQGTSHPARFSCAGQEGPDRFRRGPAGEFVHQGMPPGSTGSCEGDGVDEVDTPER